MSGWLPWSNLVRAELAKPFRRLRVDELFGQGLFHLQRSRRMLEYSVLTGYHAAEGTFQTA